MGCHYKHGHRLVARRALAGTCAADSPSADVAANASAPFARVPGSKVPENATI